MPIAIIANDSCNSTSLSRNGEPMMNQLEKEAAAAGKIEKATRLLIARKKIGTLEAVHEVRKVAWRNKKSPHPVSMALIKATESCLRHYPFTKLVNGFHGLVIGSARNGSRLVVRLESGDQSYEVEIKAKVIDGHNKRRTQP